MEFVLSLQYSSSLTRIEFFAATGWFVATALFGIVVGETGDGDDEDAMVRSGDSLIFRGEVDGDVCGAALNPDCDDDGAGFVVVGVVPPLLLLLMDFQFELLPRFVVFVAAVVEDACVTVRSIGVLSVPVPVLLVLMVDVDLVNGRRANPVLLLEL